MDIRNSTSPTAPVFTNASNGATPGWNCPSLIDETLTTTETSRREANRIRYSHRTGSSSRASWLFYYSTFFVARPGRNMVTGHTSGANRHWFHAWATTWRYRSRALRRFSPPSLAFRSLQQTWPLVISRSPLLLPRSSFPGRGMRIFVKSSV